MNIELLIATRHRRDMTKKLLKATLNPNKQQQQQNQNKLSPENMCKPHNKDRSHNYADLTNGPKNPTQFHT